MNIQHLRYAVEIEKTGSITKAAKNLYMGQPNLSKAIKELEIFLSFPVFIRTSKGTSVTPKGRKFLRYAKNILLQFDKIESIGQGNDESIQKLRLSVPRSSYISEAFTAFVSELDPKKNIDIDFCETNPLDTIEQLAQGHVNLGIIRFQKEHEPYFVSFLAEKDLVYQVLWDFKYLLLFPSQHPLALQNKIYAKDLDQYIEISYGDLSLPYRENTSDIGGKHSEHTKKIHVYERGSQFDLLTHVPDSYMWSSPMPADILKRHNLLQKPFHDSHTFKDILVYPEGYRFSLLEDRFIDKLQDAIFRLTKK